MLNHTLMLAARVALPALKVSHTDVNDTHLFQLCVKSLTLTTKQENQACIGLAS